MAKYVQRDGESNITKLTSRPSADTQERLEDDDSELIAFLTSLNDRINEPDPVMSRLLAELEALLPGITDRVQAARRA